MFERLRPLHCAPGARRLASPLAVLLAVSLAAPALGRERTSAADFPAGDEGYHTYAEMAAALASVAARHPRIVRVFSIGRSYEGRELWAAKVSDRVWVNEPEPEVLLDGLHHGDEHLSAEMVLYMLQQLVAGYGRDPQVTSIVNGREIFLVPMIDPDGGEHDVSGGAYRGWRKNRQPNEGSRHVGTDVNRNYGYRWGCCGGSSSDTWSETYRGPSRFSSPEANALRRFVASRVADGRQQLRAAISFHAAGRFIMWPYHYTSRDLPPDMTRDDRAVFAALGQRMAARNGYRAFQGGDFYRADGTFYDWAYGRHRIFAFIFELGDLGWGPHPPDERIATETTRNRGAVLYLLGQADCVYRVIGRGDVYC